MPNIAIKIPQLGVMIPDNTAISYKAMTGSANKLVVRAEDWMVEDMHAWIKQHAFAGM